MEEKKGIFWKTCIRAYKNKKFYSIRIRFNIQWIFTY